MSGMGKLNTLLDPIGSIFGFSPTEKLFGGKKKDSSPAPAVAPTLPGGLTAEKTRAGQQRRVPLTAGSVLTAAQEEKLGG